MTHKTTLASLSLWLLVTLFLPATATAIAPIVSQDEAVEVAAVYYKPASDGSGGGKVEAQGCTNCPLSFDLTGKTRLYYQGQKLNPKEAASHSGKSGTVVFDEKKRAIKIIWNAE
jgi:hypothetical protein